MPEVPPPSHTEEAQASRCSARLPGLCPPPRFSPTAAHVSTFPHAPCGARGLVALHLPHASSQGAQSTWLMPCTPLLNLPNTCANTHTVHLRVTVSAVFSVTQWVGGQMDGWTDDR